MEQKRTRNSFRAFLIGVLMIVGWMYFNLRTVVVQGTSMVPTFLPGRRVVVSDAYWLFGNIRENDIVVVKEFIKKEGGYFIKRVKFVDGDRVPRAYWPKAYSMKNQDYTVPKDMFFVLGDNRDYSEDSRSFGPIKRDLIVGKVLVWR
jgi:signal peptidase I